MKTDKYVRNRLITAVLVIFTAGATGAKATGAAGVEPKALDPKPAMVEQSTSFENTVNTSELERASNSTGAVLLDSSVSATAGLDPNPWAADRITSLEGEGWSFTDPYEVRAEGEALFSMCDLLREENNSGLLHFGTDKDIRFVESHQNRPGIPAPVGVSYPARTRRWEFFGEFAPILDATPDNALGWGGGLGIRFHLGQ